MQNLTGNMFTYAYYVDERAEERNTIRVYGLDEENNSVCVTIDDLPTLVVIELPTDRKFIWTRHAAEKQLGKFIKEKMGKQQPIDLIFALRKKLYSAQTRSDGSPNLFPILYCKFSSKKHMYRLKTILSQPIDVYKLPKNLRLKLHHHNADEILQLVSCRNMPTAGWVKYAGKSIKHPKTLASTEVLCKYKQIRGCDKNENVNPLIMSFDIEAYSHLPAKFPNANHPEDKVFMISCVFFRNNGKGFTREVLLTMGKPRDEDVGAECICFPTEGSLIEGFSQIIRHENPQIITGWNILGFDIEYLIKRSHYTGDFDGLALSGMHREFGPRKAKEVKWKSSAYRTQEFQFIDWEGRVIVDLLPFVKRDHKLNNYKLDTVSKHFLGGGGKEDLTPKELFECYEKGIKDKSKVNTEYARKRVGVAGKYCMVDSRLVARLFRKTDAWTGLTEMATTCNVPMFDLIVRGQQKRVFSQVYKYCWDNNIIVESEGYKAQDNERYVGAHVFPPKPGLYKNVIPFDFASLYPTIIIAYNIDYSTLVTDPKIPDRLCNVIEWEDHQGCEHDKKVQRVKALTLLIDEKEKEMKKMRKHRDSLRIVDFIPGYKPKTKYSKSLRDAARIMRDREKRKINKQLEKMTRELKPYREERADEKKGIPKMQMCAHRKYRFLKEPKGVIPTVLQNLLDSRKETRTLKKKLEKTLDSLSKQEAEDLRVRINVLEQRQKAKKVCANSMYGAMGVRDGYLPFMPGAMCTTAMGRRNNILAANTIVKKWGGKLIYGDTDSEYIFFPDVKGKTHAETASLLWDHAEKVAADVTKLYPPPMKLEFEEEIYHKFFILSKKRYMYKKMLRDGVVSKKLGHKGVLLSRRDNSNVVRDLYNTLVSDICDDASFSEISGWLVEQVLEMFRRQVSTDKFVITKQIGGVGSLPLLTDNKGVGENWVRKLESGYGNESPEMLEKLKEGKVIIGDYSIPILSKDPVERARQMKLKSARDSVEYYTNSLPAHVSLSMKMRARGIRVDDGTRLEHLVTLAGGHADKLFSKVEDIAYFKRHSQFLKIDFLYYLKHMTKPVDQVLNAAFRKNPVAKNFMTTLYKHWIKRQSVIQSLDPSTVLLFK